MDIFTTQLTRVMQTPIKKANLKVKALLKDAGTNKLKEDPDHLENHDYYFEHSTENESEGESLSDEANEDVSSKKLKSQNDDEKSIKNEGDDTPPRLDLFV